MGGRVGFRVLGLDESSHSLALKTCVQGLGFRVQGLGFWGLGFGDWDSMEPQAQKGPKCEDEHITYARGCFN